MELRRLLFDDDGLPVCPRCLGYIPENRKAGEHEGARSRTDNRTEVCTPCGIEEAAEDRRDGIFRNPDVALVRQEDWPHQRHRSRFIFQGGDLAAIEGC